MAHGLNSVLKRVKGGEGKAGIGSRRIFAPHFKLQVLDSYRNDADCKGNQRATARKYGIHRRQIQKWLQVEGNLRNSVGKQAARLPDDEAGRAAPPAPLDFTTRVRTPDPPAPMDLSLKRPAAPSAPAPAAPTVVVCPPALSPLRLPSPHPDVWDLSTKPRTAVAVPVAAPKPAVKLFKPYLDDVEDRKPDPPPPCCTAAGYCYYNNNNSSNNITITTTTTTTINNNNNNNNNNVCDGSYTLTELQPPAAATAGYYYPLSVPYPEYEVAPFYEDPGYVHCVLPLKQRHSYSLDFKLSAIECYYQDSVCKGNQRAVATKYNIHRRQVQKWLKQADVLRQKNETIKQTQLVR